MSPQSSSVKHETGEALDNMTGTRIPAHSGALDTLEFWLDRAFRIPGTNRRFGLDGLIGLVPGIGDTATGLISGAIRVHAWRLDARKRTLLAMLKNIGVDWLVGTIPVVGDVFDFAHKANTKNVRLLRNEITHLEKRIETDLIG